MSEQEVESAEHWARSKRSVRPAIDGRRIRRSAPPLIVQQAGATQFADGREQHPAPAGRLRSVARTIAEALGMAGLAVAVLSAAGHVLAANRQYSALTMIAARSGRGRPRFADPMADRLVGEAAGKLDVLSSDRAARAIPIRAGAGGKLVAIAYLAPVHGVARHELAGIGGILFIAPMQPPPQYAPNPQLLQQMFGLSPAEARVASGIAARQTVESMATDFGVRPDTVRCQLKSVLAKTGAKRQLDLAVLLHRLHWPLV